MLSIPLVWWIVIGAAGLLFVVMVAVAVRACVSIARSKKEVNALVQAERRNDIQGLKMDVNLHYDLLMAQNKQAQPIIMAPGDLASHTSPGPVYCSYPPHMSLPPDTVPVYSVAPPSAGVPHYVPPPQPLPQYAG